MKAPGVVLYEGPSVLTGEPIVCVLTGLGRPSRNPKTGPMLQTWVLRQDRPPTDAVRDGSDRAICGDCPLSGHAGKRRCYVQVSHAPTAIWKAWKRGVYLHSYAYHSRVHDHIRAVGCGQLIRLGAYGDPAAIPYVVWRKLTMDAAGWTGYTHQWRHPKFDARILDLCMASVESDVDIHALRCQYPHARYFRARADSEPRTWGEMQCPASDEAGHRLTCSECLACNGGVVGRSVSIAAHGSGRW